MGHLYPLKPSFTRNPLVSVADGGHDAQLRDLGRGVVRLDGQSEAVDGGYLVFSYDLPQRPLLVGAAFYQRMKQTFGSYAAASGMSAREPEPTCAEGWLPSEPARLNLEATDVTSAFSILDIPVLLDKRNYPHYHRGFTEHPDLYAVGLPWLTGHESSIVAGVGRDAEYISQHIVGNITTSAYAVTLPTRLWSTARRLGRD